MRRDKALQSTFCNLFLFLNCVLHRQSYIPIYVYIYMFDSEAAVIDHLHRNGFGFVKTFSTQN